MQEKIKNFANRNSTVWAILMALLSSFLLFIVGFVQIISQSTEKNNVEDSNPLLAFFTLILFFILGYFFFKFFTFYKKITPLLYLAITVIFITIYMSILLYSESNIQEVDTLINFISVKKWSDDGYAPPEEVLTNEFCLAVLIILNILNIFFLNIFPNKYLINKKKVNYWSLVLLTLIIIINLVFYF
ncbi:hypothetical protein [Chryseobacterium polytrichastri]|uniref:Uncharacterized protein n=1 Tax=Chryseobacterium polytrichastri TaxID=1302687 RepID=A0A1M6Y5U2_9FLAO|nr:hypothetical protein [Chryseobacterium polytrichastri]SHL13399.1 hypothetical protein SAMN05444267_101292 [Chryseobacterium polytrichastri]